MSPHPTPLSLRLIRALWSKRQLAYRLLSASLRAARWCFRRLPMPARVRALLKDMVFLSVEHLILQSSSYRRWQAESQGMGALHGVLRESEQASEALPLPEITAPTAQEWEELKARAAKPFHPHGEVDIAVIVPVYRGFDETTRCIFQLLSAPNHLRWHLLVMNDASPDIELCQTLHQLAEEGWFELIEQEENRGFVATVNRGMQHQQGRHIVLLNSDTQVFDGWLDRLHQALLHHPDTASATPLSNHAELCSYPLAFDANLTPLELSFAELDEAASRAPLALPAIPTAVGFCMALRAEALADVGLFDAETFGRGYGEENDWCLRASAKGWQHVLANQLYVMHQGSVSFGAEKHALIKQSLRRLNRRYPQYRATIRAFKQDDPLKQARRWLDLERLRRLTPDERILMVNHNAGGGTQRHVEELSAWLAHEQIGTIRLSPDDARPGYVRLWHPEAAMLPNLSYHLGREADQLIDDLAHLGIAHVHVHHLTGFPRAMALWIQRGCAVWRCAYDVTLHDYYLMCPSTTLLVKDAPFDAEPSLEDSQHWADRHPSDAGIQPLWQWREQHIQFLAAARRRFAPSSDAAHRIARMSGLAVDVRPHPYQRAAPLSPVQRRAHAPLHVAVAGHLARHKGAGVMRALVEDASARGLPIIYHLFGAWLASEACPQSDHLLVHGAYEEADIHQLLRESGCQIGLVPSIWPETFSYTLSAIIESGLHPVCFDLGAPAERLRELGIGSILPREWFAQAQPINDALLALPLHVHQPASLPVREALYPSILEHYYELMREEATPSSSPQAVVSSPRPHVPAA